MKLLRTTVIALILIVGLSTENAKGSHIVGHMISYVHDSFSVSTGNHYYTVTVTLYRDPYGINLPSNIALRVTDDSTNTAVSGSPFSMPRINTDTVTSAPYVCVFDPNTVDSLFWEIGTYEQQILVPPSTVGYSLVYQECCRNVVIVNLTFGQGITLYSHIPPTSFQNNSPVFITPIVPFICDSISVNFASGAMDPDGDSLVYDFALPYKQTPMVPPFDTVQYVSNYSFRKPFGPGSNSTITNSDGNGSHLSSTTGHYVVAVEVKEFRSGTLLGRHIKEMQVMVYNCSTVVDKCVWPGDANDDGIANNMDLLEVAIALGSSGPARVGGSNDWFAQVANDWAGTFSTGVNYKYADCDGGGTVNLADTLAIFQNYGFAHSKHKGTGSSGPGDPLELRFGSGSVNKGQSVTAEIHFGTPSDPADNIFGIAATVWYDRTQVDSGSLDYDLTTWMGTSGSNLISLGMDTWDNEQFDFAMARTDKAHVTNHGKIGEITFNIDSNATSGPMMLRLINVRVIDSLGNEYPIQTIDDTTVISGLTDVNAEEPQILLYPNPTTGLLYIDIGQQEVVSVAVFDLLGRQVLEAPASTRVINTKDLSSGLYFLRALTDKGRALARFVVAERD